MRKQKMLPVMALACLMALSACQKEATVETVTLSPVKEASVTVLTPQKRTLSDQSTWKATVKGRTTNYSFTLSGAVDEVTASLGETVSSGDLLMTAVLSTKEEERESLAKAFLNKCLEVDDLLAEAENEILDLDEMIDLARTAGKTYLRELWSLDREEVLLDRDHDLWYLNREAAGLRKDIEALDAKTGEGSLLAKTKGLVVRLANKGDRTGMDVVSVMTLDTDHLWLSLDTLITKADLSDAKRISAGLHGMEVPLTFMEMTDEDYQTSLKLGEETRLVPAEGYPALTIEDLSDSVTVTLVKEEYTDVLSLEKDAIGHDQQGDFVWVEEEGRKVRRSVLTGFCDGIYTQIMSGLTGEEKVLFEEEPLDGQWTPLEVTSLDLNQTRSYETKMAYPLEDRMVPVQCYDPLASTMSVLEYAVKTGDSVMEGDLIGTVGITYDEDACEEERLNLAEVKRIQAMQLFSVRESLKALEEAGTLTESQEEEKKTLLLEEECLTTYIEKELAEREEALRLYDERKNVRSIEVYAPVSGQVIFNEDGFGQSGDNTLAFIVSDLSEWYVIPSSLGNAGIGSRLTLDLVNEAGETKTVAHATLVSSAAYSGASQKVIVSVDPEDQKALLEAGLFGEETLKVTRDGGEKEVILAVKTEMIEAGYVWLVKGDTAVRRPVVTGSQYGDLTEILAGLSAGDRIAG